MTGEDSVDRVERVCHRREVGAVVMVEQRPHVGVQREALDSFRIRDPLDGGAGSQGHGALGISPVTFAAAKRFAG
ncbi:hypothetical protein ACFYTQ_36510 [Nocardia sp. NPDC004068]|uniref:hypothetical protein n=1 Tax=Nocardia sp. NPDC004068 TaxID=3364303 RepID=UPI003675C6FF